MKHNNKITGFTLIELMIGVAIGAVLLGIAIPNFEALRKNNCLTTRTNSFVSSLQYARSEAVLRKSDINVTSNSGGSNYGSGWTITDGTETLKTINTTSCANTTVVAFNLVTPITYELTGYLKDDDGGFIQICDDRDDEIGREIAISGLGRPLAEESVKCNP